MRYSGTPILQIWPDPFSDGYPRPNQHYSPVFPQSAQLVSSGDRTSQSFCFSADHTFGLLDQRPKSTPDISLHSAPSSSGCQSVSPSPRASMFQAKACGRSKGYTSQLRYLFHPEINLAIDPHSCITARQGKPVVAQHDASIIYWRDWVQAGYLELRLLDITKSMRKSCTWAVIFLDSPCYLNVRTEKCTEAAGLETLVWPCRSAV
jgi:hypothetical protein